MSKIVLVMSLLAMLNLNACAAPVSVAASTISTKPGLNSPTGQTLLEVCTEDNFKEVNENAFYCLGYFIGFRQTADTFTMMYDKEKLEAIKGAFCMPKEVTNQQRIKIVLKYINNHPEQLHLPASFLIITAYSEAFPMSVCEKRLKGK